MTQLTTASIVTVSYVFVIYLFSFISAGSKFIDRDNITVVKARIYAVSLFALICIYYTGIPRFSVVPLEIFKSLLLLTPLILINTHTQLYHFKCAAHRKGYLKMMADFSKELILEPAIAISQPDLYYLRDFIIGPIVEECIFRHAIMHIVGLGRCVTSATLFSLAHSHTILMGYPIVAVMMQCLFTFIFGVYVSDIYRRTLSLPTCIIIHSLANRVGFPDLIEFGGLSSLSKLIHFFILFFCLLIYCQL